MASSTFLNRLSSLKQRPLVDRLLLFLNASNRSSYGSADSPSNGFVWYNQKSGYANTDFIIYNPTGTITLNQDPPLYPQQEYYDAPAVSSNLDAQYTTTSTTNETIVSSGSLTFIVGTGLDYVTNDPITIANNISNYMEATVTSYNSGTGQLDVTVTGSAGSGTYSNWQVNIVDSVLNSEPTSSSVLVSEPFRPRYLSLRYFDDGNSSNPALVDYISVAPNSPSVLIMDLGAGTGFNVASRTIECWTRIVAPPGHPTTTNYTRVENGVNTSVLYGGLHNINGVLKLFDNQDNTCNICWSWDDSSTTSAFHATKSITLNTWTQIVTVLEPSVDGPNATTYRCTYYVNGVPAGSIVNNDAALDVSGYQQDWRIGSSKRTTEQPSGSGLRYALHTHCDIAMFKQYDFALTSEQVARNYINTKDKFAVYLMPLLTPTNLTATASVGDNGQQIALSWTASGGGVGGVAYYEIQRSADSDTGPWTSTAVSQVTSLLQTRLKENTTYYYRVRAADNNNNYSDWSLVAQATTGTFSGGDVTAPTVPSGLSTTVESSTSITVSWTASTDTESGIQSYVVQRSTDQTNWTNFTTTNTTLTFTGLNASTTYYFKVSAIDNADNQSAFSGVVSDTTQSAPTGGGVIAPVTFETGFDSTLIRKHNTCGDISVITGSITENGETILPRSGTKFLRSYLDRSNPCTPGLTYRAESNLFWPKANPNTTWYTSPNSNEDQSIAVGVEYWFAISVYVPTSWDTNYTSAWDTGILWQFHDKNWTDPVYQADKRSRDWRHLLPIVCTHEAGGLAIKTSTWSPPGGLGYIATASISGTTMTVTATSKNRPMPGRTVTGTGIAAGTKIVRILSGDINTGIGTFEVNISQTVSSRTIKGGITWAQAGFFENWNGNDPIKDTAGLTDSLAKLNLTPQQLGLTWDQCRGRWIDFAYNFKVSGANSPNDKTGFRKIWVNRNLVFSDVGQNNYGEQQLYLQNLDDSGHYLQFGIYNWGWRTEHASKWTNISERTVYHDDIRFGNSSATFKDMHPDGLDKLS